MNLLTKIKNLFTTNPRQINELSPSVMLTYFAFAMCAYLGFSKHKTGIIWTMFSYFDDHAHLEEFKLSHSPTLQITFTCDNHQFIKYSVDEDGEQTRKGIFDTGFIGSVNQVDEIDKLLNKILPKEQS